MKHITDNEMIDTSRGHKRLGGLFDENAMLRAQNEALVAALEAINARMIREAGEAGELSTNEIDCLEIARAAIAKVQL